MREIKFRAWHKGSQTICQVSTLHLDTGEVLLECDEDDEYWHQQKDLPLMQFTGLHDKNGKEIYEGDILEQAVPLSDRYIDKGVVEFSEGFFIIKANSGKHQIVSDWIKIIGNIYENPELLKGA